MNYYNEIDPYAAQWLRNLIAAGHLAPGDVDERSIEDVLPDELRKYTQCHFFAGIGVWALALDNSGWPRDRPVWTGSCPCQPFSAAGKGGGFSDERHLWPAWQHLINQCRPAVIFGEQVASKAVDDWIDLVHADMEGMGYAFGGIAFPSASVGAPHIRDRAFWVADAGSTGSLPGALVGIHRGQDGAGPWNGELERPRANSGLADADGRDSSAEREQRSGEQRQQPQDGGVLRMADAIVQQRPDGQPGFSHVDDADGRIESAAATTRLRDDLRPGPTNGFWRAADWLGCTDGKWRPVEPGTFPLVDGASSRMVCVCPDCKTETVIYEGMHSLRRTPIANEGRRTEEILRQGMLQAASFVAATHEQKHGLLPREGSREESGMPPMWGRVGFGGPSPGPERLERQAREPGAGLLDLPSSGTHRENSGVDMRSVWAGVHRSLASEREQDLLCPMCERVGPQECTEEMGGSRVGRLRAYGNAINAQAAQVFIESYLGVE